MKAVSYLIISCLLVITSCSSPEGSREKINISGVYPHMAFYNDEGECGTGAVVPWAGKLWAITYGPHLPFGSSDKLYEISPGMDVTIRPESVGGTPADRMIHKESNQLFIGSYAIDNKGNVRVISLKDAPGRYTGLARHLTEPGSKIYIGTMEEGFYEVNVNTLATTMLYPDGNVRNKLGDVTRSNKPNDLLPGAHGKGLYSGQGVLVYSNNGETGDEALKKFNVESGSLSEWNGTEWKVVRRNQFVEVTGPGGIYGNPDPGTDPIWATGWDYKSLLLGVRENGEWIFFRLPKASYSYDGAHGWNTEWPRIRDIGIEGQPDYLMTMHGMFWRFPGSFSRNNTAGIRPRSAYLKVIGDFTRWNDRLVFGCDDSAQKEFLNKRKAKGNIEGPGQSNSNLWFTTPDLPDQLGPANASGYIWMDEDIKAGIPSEPFLFAGWSTRSAWVKNSGNQTVTFRFETDRDGKNTWTDLSIVKLKAGESTLVGFGDKDRGEWVRVSTDKDTRGSTAFVYAGTERRTTGPDPIFDGIATIRTKTSTGGLLYGLGNNRRTLGILSSKDNTETGYYELDSRLDLIPKKDDQTASFIREKFAIPQQAVEIVNGSVLIIDDSGRRWRIPLGDGRYTDLTRKAALRICREVATERDLFNCHGTFYELPAENADGYAKIRPIASHQLKINDYASYRGLLIISGIDPEKSGNNPRIFHSEDGQSAIWAGVIDDLWKLGKPTGRGGPWADTGVQAGIPSDPYLIGFYDQKDMTLSHQSDGNVTFTIEVDPTGDGDWIRYENFVVKPGEKYLYRFPQSFLARWIRFKVDKNTTATTWLEYR